jgi:plasmid stabilization system protein ParE
MNLSHIFSPKAYNEYELAVIWYAERSISAAERFIAEINTKIGLICASPATYRTTYKNFKESSLNKFPYSIVFSIDEKAGLVIIHAIYHHKRNPVRKYKR